MKGGNYFFFLKNSTLSWREFLKREKFHPAVSLVQSLLCVGGGGREGDPISYVNTPHSLSFCNANM